MSGSVLTADRILLAAEDALRRYGPAKATVVDVGKVLGVSHAAIYRHFPSKTALREAVSRRWLNRDRDALAAVAHDTAIPPPHRLRAWLAAVLAAKRARASADPELFAAFRILAAENNSAGVDHVADLLAQLAGIIADGVADGSFRAADPMETAQVVFTATTRFHHPALASEWQTPGIENELDTVCTLLLDGLNVRAGKPAGN